MSSSGPTRTQILRLYRRYLSTAQSFSSYNFRTYFLRRSRDMFRSALLPPAQAATTSPFSKAANVTAPAVPTALVHASSSTPQPSSPPSQDQGTAEERVKAFYERAEKELDVLRRAAILNRLYQGEKLVVEQPRIIVGGGGAGAEAGTGGAGQPL
ncbi:hypothetical protein OC861_001675 [Tilletia horrida]|nr:hypothetical protein OC845_004337 [Tilletia horrida]KAK0568673.1 hypothetical protein OC861_001675 [Tilletia horrida]